MSKKSLFNSRKYFQKNPVIDKKEDGSYKVTKINPFIDSYEIDMGKYGKSYTGQRKTDLQTGGGKNTLTRKIEREAENRKIDEDMRRDSEAFQRKLDAVEGRGYKGPLADVADKYFGPIAYPIGDAIEEGYSKLLGGAKKIKKKIKQKIKGNKKGNFVEVPVKLARTKPTRLY
jgi:hypothetical protein